MSSARTSTVLTSLAILLLLGFLARLAVGAGFGFAWPEDPLLLEIRSSRAFSAGVVGAGLALAGVLLQSLLRNPLASPDLLGLSSGAGLGVMLAAYLAYVATGHIAPASSLGGGFGAPGAILGSAATLAMVYAVSQRSGQIDPLGLVLVGVIVSVVAGACIQLIQRLLPDGGLAVSRMLIGTIPDDVEAGFIWGNLIAVLAVVSAGLLARRWLDAFSMGVDEARSVGVPVDLLKSGMLIAAGTLTAGTVMIAGPIGFVGLVVPHAVRMVLGPSHGPLLLGAVLLGAFSMVLADVVVAGVRLPSGRLPVGVVTALVGGPAFVVLLRRTMRTGS